MSAIQALLVDSAFTPVTNTYDSGSGTETVPAGATSCTVSVWGSGAAGGRDVAGGNAWGGGGGGYCTRAIAVVGGDSFSYSVAASVAGRATDGDGANGNASSVTGTVSGGSVSMTANGGSGVNTSAGVGGAGGTASGGTTNTTGGTGTATTGGAGANGGAGGAAKTAGTAPGGGGGPCNNFGSSGGGAAGRVTFSYT